jgi:hypothetical protein
MDTETNLYCSFGFAERIIQVGLASLVVCIPVQNLFAVGFPKKVLKRIKPYVIVVEDYYCLFSKQLNET